MPAASPTSTTPSPAARRARRDVRVSTPPPRDVVRYSVLRLQKRYETRGGVREAVRIEPSKTDVQIILLAKAPAVACEILAEIQLRNTLGHPERPPVACIDRKLHFLRRDQPRALRRCVQGPRDWTEMPACADEHRCLDRVVDNPIHAFATQ